MNAERQRSRDQVKKGQVSKLSVTLGSSGSEANEFENELLKSGSESTVGRMQTGYRKVEQNAVNLETFDESGDVMQLG